MTPNTQTPAELEPYTGQFAPMTVQIALRVLAEAGGNHVKAHARLEAEFAEHLDKLPSLGTLQAWKDVTYPARYRQIVNENDVQLEEIVKSQLRTAQVQQGAIQGEVLTRLAANIPAIPPEKLADTASKLSLSRGIDIDKLRLLEDKPTQILETRDATSILNDIAGRLNIIDTTAEEEHEASNDTQHNEAQAHTEDVARQGS